MNGFLLNINSRDESQIHRKISIPDYPDDSVFQLAIDKCISLYLWGNPPGDIHYSNNVNHSLLILNGYVAEGHFKEDFRTQQHAADLLREHLDSNHSIEYCKTIADQIYGSFSIIYINIKENTVYCISDRIASRPTWVKIDKDSLIIATNAILIAQVSNTSDYDMGSLGALFLYGGPVEPTKSIYSGIESLEPGTILSIGSNGISKRNYWYQYKHKPENKMSRNEWVDLVAQRLRKSATRILNSVNNPMIFFSGGVDSRLTAAAMRAVGGKPILVTLGDDVNLEVRVAKKAATALDCEHRIILRDPHWYLRSLSKTVFETGGSFVWTHGHFSSAYGNFRSEHDVDAAMLGDFCEAFSKLCFTVGNQRNSVWTSQEFLQLFDSLPLPLYRPQNREFTMKLFKPKVQRQINECLQNDILSRYNRICCVSEDFRIVGDSFFRWHSAATIPTFFMFLDVRSAGPERSIMFDKDVHSLLEILPGKMRDGYNLGASIIKKLWPKAAYVVNSNSLVPVIWPNKLNVTAKAIKPYLGKLRRLIFDNSYKTTASFPEKSLLYLHDCEWRAFMEGILNNPALFDNDIFDHNAIKECWSIFCKGNLSVANDLEKLIEMGLLTSNSNL